MAVDNVMAGIYGGLQGANDILGKYVDYKLQSRLKRQEDYLNPEDIPASLHTQYGLPSTQGVRKELLPYVFAKSPTLKNEMEPVYTSDQLRKMAAQGLPIPKNHSIVPDEKVSEEDKITQKLNAQKAAMKPKALNSVKKTYQELQDNVDTIDELLNDPYLSRGVGMQGSVMGKLPGSKAVNIQSKIKTIQAKTFLNSFLDLKRNSPNGASGLGALSDAEGERLAAAIGNLNPQQSLEDIKPQLEKVKRAFQSSQANLLEGFRGEYGEDAPINKNGNLPIVNQSSMQPVTKSLSPRPGGVLHIDKNGNKAYVYPDGSYDEVK